MNWYSLGSVLQDTPLLLAADANTRIYFRPTSNYNATISNALTFRAWDRTSGTNGSTFKTTTFGGTSNTVFRSVNVTSVNDAPVITSNQSFSVSENAAIGTVVGTVVATDVDSTVFSNWAITSGNLDKDGDGQTAFTINSNSGQITVSDGDELDFESNPSFQLQVTGERWCDRKQCTNSDS